MTSYELFIIRTAAFARECVRVCLCLYLPLWNSQTSTHSKLASVGALVISVTLVPCWNCNACKVTGSLSSLGPLGSCPGRERTHARAHSCGCLDYLWNLCENLQLTTVSTVSSSGGSSKDIIIPGILKALTSNLIASLISSFRLTHLFNTYLRFKHYC